METEAKAKVVAAVWGATFIQFFASCFASADLEEKVEFLLFIQTIIFFISALVYFAIMLQ